jgi:N-acetyl-1-D-myo-inositol-2-amino-2-deoxy-alpha-D-glucopyranoside deacetylase
MTEALPVGEHVVFVHAHPDDETIETGGTIALLLDAGTSVTVVTATRGERGDVIPDDLHALRTDPLLLGRHREGELRAAMRELGVTDHRFLGSEDARSLGLPPRRYLDSGMQWGEDGNPQPVEPVDPRSLCGADPEEVASDVLEVVLATDATAIVTYNAYGGYGHPDHIAVHRAAARAARVAGVPVFAIEYPESAASASRAAVAERGRFAEPTQHGTTTVPDGSAPIRVDVSAQLPRKIAALRAHRSQVVVDGDQFGLSNGSGEVVRAAEYFRPMPPESDDSYAPTLLHRLLGYGLAALVGVLFGAISTAAHRVEWTVAGVALPVGLVLALVSVSALLIGLRLVLHDRYYVGAAAVGIIAACVAFSTPGAGGSALFPESLRSVLWTVVPPLVATVVVAWPRLPERRA